RPAAPLIVIPLAMARLSDNNPLRTAVRSQAFAILGSTQVRRLEGAALYPGSYSRQIVALLLFRRQLGDLREYLVKLGRKPLERILAFLGVWRKHSRRLLVR